LNTGVTYAWRQSSDKKDLSKYNVLYHVLMVVRHINGIEYINNPAN